MHKYQWLENRLELLIQNQISVKNLFDYIFLSIKLNIDFITIKVNTFHTKLCIFIYTYSIFNIF